MISATGKALCRLISLEEKNIYVLKRLCYLLAGAHEKRTDIIL